MLFAVYYRSAGPAGRDVQSHGLKDSATSAVRWPRSSPPRTSPGTHRPVSNCCMPSIVGLLLGVAAGEATGSNDAGTSSACCYLTTWLLPAVASPRTW